MRYARTSCTLALVHRSGLILKHGTDNQTLVKVPIEHVVSVDGQEVVFSPVAIAYILIRVFLSTIALNPSRNVMRSFTLRCLKVNRALMCVRRLLDRMLGRCDAIQTDKKACRPLMKRLLRIELPVACRMWPASAMSSTTSRTDAACVCPFFLW